MAKTLHTILLLGATVLNAVLHAQNPQKTFFDKYGRAVSETNAYYYRNATDTQGFYRSFFVATERPCFEGYISKASMSDENENVFSGKCRWYHRNNNLRSEIIYNSNGKKDGLARQYYESGKIWKEIEYQNGHIKGGTYTEYNEDGVINRIFEENFINNFNEWDLYESDKSQANITDGKLKLRSLDISGTSRFINHAIDASEYTIEVSIDPSSFESHSRAGILYGFKDWENYHYFAISKQHIFLGSFYEGVKTSYIDEMFCSNIKEFQENNVKIICTGEKTYFSVNGEIQSKRDAGRLFGNNFGLVVSGKTALTADDFVIKEINTSKAGNISGAADDKDVKGTGSGLLFSANGYILTNYHVVVNSNRLSVEILEGGIRKIFPADLVIHDRENDLAIIKIKDPEFKPVPLMYAFKENGLIEVGSSVFTIGYPHALTGMGKEAKFTDGKVSSKTGYNGGMNSFQTTIPVQPGNSGGPVFNSDGQLIGIVNSTFREADNVSYAIKLNYILNLIEMMSEPVAPPANNTIQTLTLEEKLKVLTDYVVLIKVK